MTGAVVRSVEAENRRMLRARDAIDRDYKLPLDVAGLAAVAHVSEAHFIRSFKRTFGETPHRYLQRRRIERAMYLLRTTDRTVTDVCMEVGFSSLGSFSSLFSRRLGEAPSAYQRRIRTSVQVPGGLPAVLAPGCLSLMSRLPPSAFHE